MTIRFNKFQYQLLHQEMYLSIISFTVQLKFALKSFIFVFALKSSVPHVRYDILQLQYSPIFFEIETDPVEQYF